MNTYVMNVELRKEEHFKNFLEHFNAFAPYYERIWVPKKPHNLKIGGTPLTEYRILFPGYLFVDSNENYDRIYRTFIDLHIATYFNLMGKKEDALRTVREEELRHIKQLAGECVSQAVIIGGRIHFLEGSPLYGLDGYVIKYDRHKRNVCLRMEFFGRMIDVWIAVEEVRQADGNGPDNVVALKANVIDAKAKRGKGKQLA